MWLFGHHTKIADISQDAGQMASKSVNNFIKSTNFNLLSWDNFGHHTKIAEILQDAG